MIKYDYEITVNGNQAKLNKDIYLFRGNKNVHYYFAVKNASFNFKGSTDLIEKTNAINAAVTVIKPNNVEVASAIAKVENGKIHLKVTEDLIDEEVEVGDFDLVFDLFDDTDGAVTIPKVIGQFHVLERPCTTPISELVATNTTNEVDQALTDYAIVTYAEPVASTNADGTFAKKTWVAKEKITTAELNRMEEGISDVSSQCKDIANNFSTEQTDSSFIIKYGNKIIAEIPLNTTPSVYGNIVVDATNLEITEGGTGTFTVKLDQTPTKNQTINITSSNEKVTVNPSTLIFTPSNYNTTQTVTVSAKDDNIEDNGYTLTLTLSSDKVTNVVINITIKDNDLISVSYTLADENDFTIENMAGEKYLSAYIGTKEYVEVPTNISVSGVSILSRYNGAFANNETIKGIKFQDGVNFYSGGVQNCKNLTVIEGHKGLSTGSLKNCVNLKKVINCKGQYIQSVFEGCSSLKDLSDFHLDSNITSITHFCYNCINLVYGATVDEGFTCNQLSGAYEGCTQLSEITINSTTVDFGCTSSSSASPFYDLSQSIKMKAPLNSSVHTSFKNDMCKRLSKSNRKFIPLTGGVKNISLFGDSLTDGYNSDTTNYPTFLNQKYDNNTIVYNFGRSGYTMAQIGEIVDNANLHLNDDAIVIWGGTNSPVSAQEHLQQEKELISKLSTENYIIVGLTKDGLWSATEDELFTKEFGNKYLNVRQYILNNWETITGLTPTEQESQQVQNGSIPESLRLATGDTHFNTNGNKVIAQAIYDKIQELGYLS